MNHPAPSSIQKKARPGDPAPMRSKDATRPSAPLLSVIIPVYNTGEDFVKLYHSIEKDRYKNLEILVVDDGSTDDSLKILRALVAKDKRIRLFAQKNSGASSARNLALKKITGKYVFFIDSDDDILPSHFTKLTQKLEAGAGLVSCGYRYHRVYNDRSHDTYTNPPVARQPHDTDLSYILRQDVKDGRLYAATNKAFRADIIKTAGLSFDTKKSFAEDTKFVLDYLSALIKANDRKISTPKTAETQTADPEALDLKSTKPQLVAPKTPEAQTPETLQIGYVLEATYLYHYGTATSTVRESSLIWQNWLNSFQDFKTFATAHDPQAPRLSPKTRRLLHRLKIRFHISHAFAVARSNQTFRQKLKYTNLFKLLPAEVLVKFRK